jgi:hypothetical protein
VCVWLVGGRVQGPSSLVIYWNRLETENHAELQRRRCPCKTRAVVTRRAVVNRLFCINTKNCSNPYFRTPRKRLEIFLKKHPFREEAQEYVTVANRFLMAQQQALNC